MKIKIVSIIISIIILSLFISLLIDTLRYNFISNSHSTLTVIEDGLNDTVKLDNKYFSDTPILKKDITSGFHTIEISKNKNQSSYFQFTQEIFFEKNTNTTINIMLGPNRDYSQYIIFSYKKDQPDKTKINILLDNYLKTDSSIYLNSDEVKNNTVNEVDEGKFNLSVSKDTYQKYSTQINTTKGYILNIFIHLAKNPL